jgi:hypothetical protein
MNQTVIHVEESLGPQPLRVSAKSSLAPRNDELPFLKQQLSQL